VAVEGSDETAVGGSTEIGEPRNAGAGTAGAWPCALYGFLRRLAGS
jgi:hypothetical protein